MHCPENIDRSSWGVMCKLRREKIRMEEDLRSLAKEVAEAEVILSFFFPFFLHFSQVIVEQRGESHAIVEKKIAELKAGLQQFHKTKIDLINNRWWEEKPKDNPFCSRLFFFIISLQSGRCN